jgi:hypothetical protein
MQCRVRGEHARHCTRSRKQLVAHKSGVTTGVPQAPNQCTRGQSVIATHEMAYVLATGSSEHSPGPSKGSVPRATYFAICIWSTYFWVDFATFFALHSAGPRADKGDGACGWDISCT